MTPTPEQALLATHRLLQALTAVHTAFSQGHPAPRLFDPLLLLLVELTGSEVGFIAEVVRSPEGKPSLQPQALTNLVWAPGLREPSPGEEARGLKISTLRILSEAVLMSGQPVVSNHRMTEAPRARASDGHRPLRAFLGLPLHANNELVGMVGLANRPDGYDAPLLSFLLPCLAMCGALMVGMRGEQRRHRAEEELRRTQESFRTLIEQAPDAILIHREGTVVFANPAAAMLLGYAGAQELLGRPVAECAEPGQEAALTEPSSSSLPREVRLRHHQGRPAVGEVVTIPLVFDGGPAVACLARDVSERLQTQERLLATERLASLGTLTAGMAHELNNPLAYMLDSCRDHQAPPPGHGAGPREHLPGLPADERALLSPRGADK